MKLFPQAMTISVGCLALAALVIATSSTQALRPPFDALHEARKRMVQRKLSAAGVITGFSLINAATDAKVADLANGTVIDLSSFLGMTTPSFNINASFSGDPIGSVKFVHNGSPKAHTENYAWYSLCGNRGNDFFNCSSLSVGNHTVTATPYAKRFSKGDAGVPYTISFSVVLGNVSPSPVAVPTSTPPDPTSKDTAPLSPSAVILPSPVAAPMDMDFHGNSSFAKPKLLDLKVSSSRVDVTSGPASIEVQVLMDNDESFISALSVIANAPELNHQTGDYCDSPQRFINGTVECNFTLEFVQYIPGGTYSLEIYVHGPDYGFAIVSAQLEEQLLPHIVKVMNDNVDSTGPLLLDFDALSSTTVNITTDDVSVEFLCVLQDDLSGIGYGYVEALDSDGVIVTQGYFNAIDFPQNNSKAGDLFTVAVSVLFSSYNRPGTYLLRVLIGDKTGNEKELDADQLDQLSFPSSVEIINLAFDDVPPVLLDFAIHSPTSVDVTYEPQTIAVKALVQDIMSGVQSVFLQAVSDSDNTSALSAQSYFSLENPIAGEVVPIDLTLVIPRYIRSGLYKLEFHVTDARGNTFSSSNEELANQTSTYFIDVVNKLEDFTPPRLINLVVLSPTVVNSSSTMTSIEIQMVVQDDVAGVTEFYISAYNELDGSGMSFYPDKKNSVDFPSDGQPRTCNASFIVKQSTKPGQYALQVGLWDAASNYAYYDSEQLGDMNLIQSVEVVNPEYDGEPPDLVDLVLLSSSDVNITLAPGIVEIQVVVQDGISGFSHGTVELLTLHSSTNPVANQDGDSGETASDSEAAFKVGRTEESTAGVPYSSYSMTLPSGLAPGLKKKEISTKSAYFYYGQRISHASFSADEQLFDESSVYNVSLLIPQYIQPGKYAFQIILYDFAENVAFFGEFELSGRALPFQVEVSNLITDDEPPQLVDFTALSPLELDVMSGPVAVEFQVTVQDVLSGVQYAYVAVSGPGNSYDYYEYSETTFDVTSAVTPVTFNVTFTFEPFHTKGRYNIEVWIIDRANRFVNLLAKDLTSLGFPASVVLM